MLQDVRFSCPDCSGHIVVDASVAGYTAPCPHCGHKIVIPEPVEVPAVAAAADTVAAPPPVMAPPKAKAGGLHMKKREDDIHDPHGGDVNVDLPFTKKKDQWFTGDGKHYHFCTYNSHAREMNTACGKLEISVTADVAPNPLSRVRKSSFCRECLDALGLNVSDL